MPVYGFSKTYIAMVTNKKYYVTLDPDDDEVVFRYEYRDTMIAQFKQDFYNKTFSLQIKVNVIKSIISRTEINFGLIFFTRGSNT